MPERLKGAIVPAAPSRLFEDRTLTGQGIPYVVAEQNRERVEQLLAMNIPSVSGMPQRLSS